MTHPYQDLPPSRFWRTAVGERSPFQIEGLWNPKYKISSRIRIATAGSCFAQHFSKALVARGYKWINAEPGPASMTPQALNDFHYGTFSARTGNIYTSRMLHQWLSWANGTATPPDEVWETDGRFFDPFRPTVEPGGFASAKELHASRRITIDALRDAVDRADVFVFTLGLTEAWQNAATGTEYAICPGTMAGTFDDKAYEFVNHGFAASLKHLRSAIAALRKIKPRIMVLLTVSPVPLTATASNEHVLTATTYSKSVLRAVAAEVCQGKPDLDYFPSYEIITHPAFRGMFYQANQRSVDPHGVAVVMEHFFRDQSRKFTRKKRQTGAYGVTKEFALPFEEDGPVGEDAASAVSDTDDDIRCEEELLDAFSK